MQEKMTWIENFRLEFCDEALDFSSEGSILLGIFRSITAPEIYLNSKGTICLPEKFCIVMGGSRILFRILMQPDLFHSMSLPIRKAILDVLFLLMNREPFDIVRLQFMDEMLTTTESYGLCKVFLRLLSSTMSDRSLLSLSKRIIHLIGLSASIGASAQDMRKILILLRSPTELSISLLQALQIMIRLDIGASKAYPQTFFSFGGIGAGLTTSTTNFPFAKEYQFCTWFRVERFQEEDYETHLNIEDKKQHILQWQNPSYKGLDMYLENKSLVVAVINNTKTDPILIKLTNYPIVKGVWYHISIRHSKPKMALFSSDELAIILDNEIVFQESIRFPNLGTMVDTDFMMGKNFNGQLGPAYFFNEVLSPIALSTIAKIDSGRNSDTSMGVDSLPADLLKGVTSSDRKHHAILSKVAMSYHPSRCSNNYALDIHSGRHASLGVLSQPWNIVSPRDLLSTMGGVSCLLPLFPRLLIENDATETTGNDHHATSSSAGKRFSVPSSSSSQPPSPMREANDDTWGVGLGTSIAETWDMNSMNQLLDQSVIVSIKQKKEELLGDGCLSLLLFILSKSIANHKQYQFELLQNGGVEMIEYALSCVPPEILLAEGERCVMSILQFKSSASDLPALEMRIAKSLLCNISLWCGASFPFLSSLMSVMFAALKAQPDIFLRIVGVKAILDGLDFFYSIENEIDFISPMTSAPITATNTPMVTQESAVEDFIKDSDKDFYNSSNSNDESKPVKPATSPIAISMDALKQETTSYSVDTPPPSITSKRSFNQNDGGSTKTPRSSVTASSMKASLRKLKSFKLALSETLNDEDEQSPEMEIEPDLSDANNEGLDAGDDVFPGHHPVHHHSQHHLTDLEAVVGNSSKKERRRSSLRIENPLEINNTNTQSTIISEIPEEDDGLEIQSDAPSNIEAPVSPQNNLQRKVIREYLESMLVILILQGGSDKEVIPLIDYMAICKDSIVLAELAKVLLFLMVEGGSKIINAVVTACNGPEEFASFVLLYLVHHSHEELRVTGIRLLTHFYAKLDQTSAPTLPFTLSMKGKRRPLSLALVATVPHGIHRLQDCGGLALLCEIVSSHCRVSSSATYASLLEMLLHNKSWSRSVMSVQFSGLLDQFNANHNHNTGATHRQRAASTAHSPPSSTQMQDQYAIFAGNYIMKELHNDDPDMFNQHVLPIFFELAPKFPMDIHEQIYTDLLSLLKQSVRNRQTFCSFPAWHICMFDLVNQLVDAATAAQLQTKYLKSEDIAMELEVWNGTSSLDSPQVIFEKPKLKSTPSSNRMRLSSGSDGELLRSWKATGAYDSSIPTTHTNKSNSSSSSVGSTGGGVGMYKSMLSLSMYDIKNTSNIDMWYDLGMKVYSTLLLHAVEYKAGWKEVDQTIAPSIDNHIGYTVVQSILSHLVNELTFNMRSKYKELQKLAKSSNIGEQQMATDKLENVLSIMITASQVALLDQPCLVGDFPDFIVSKLRIQTFNELARELHAKKIDNRASPSVESTASSNSKASNSPIDTFDIANFSPGEMKALLQDTEVKLGEKIRLRRQGSGKLANANSADGNEESTPIYEADPVVEEGGINPFQNIGDHFNFNHEWLDLAADGNTNQSTGRTKSSSMDGGYSSNNNSSTPAPSKAIEELLHPLGRVHDLISGKLIVVLQTLRFFDVIFWPYPDSNIRNTDMLRFSKESLQQSASAATSSGATSASTAKKTEAPGGTRIQMTVFSATMRMCIYSLNHLSPMTYLAVLNIKRMRALINGLDRISTYNTPTHDWLLACLAHVSYHVQRMVFVLAPVYTMLGMTALGEVSLVGPWSDSYDDFDRLDATETETIFQAIENKELLYRVQQYFNSSMGRNLLRNIRNSLQLLIEMFETHSSKLFNAMEERSYRSLWVLVEQIKADLQVSLNNPHETFSPASRKTNPKATGSRMDDVSVDGAGDIFDGTTTSNASNFAALSAANFARLPSAIGLRSISVSERSDSTSDVASIPTFTAADAAAAAAAPSFSVNGAQSPEQNPAAPTPADPYMEESFSGFDILLVLKWLRYPYFRLNVFRSLQIIKSLEALHFLEDKSNAKFIQESKVMHQTMNEHRDFAVKSIDEMQELKELSREVCRDMCKRQNIRMYHYRLQDQLKTKNVASKWHDCLQCFEADWSPWRSDLETSLSERLLSKEYDAVACYEVGKHRDAHFRNMLLTQLSEPINHKNAAYLESKLKDQLEYLMQYGDKDHITEEQKTMYLAMQEQDTNNTNTVSTAGGQVTDKSTSYLPFKVSQSRTNANANNTTTWGDDDIFEDSKSSNPAGTNSSGNMNPSLEDEANASGYTGMVEVSKKRLVATFFHSNEGEKRPAWTYFFHWQSDERILLQQEVTQITVDQTVAGTLLLTNKCLYFHGKKRMAATAISSSHINNHNASSGSGASAPYIDRRWYLDQLIEIYGRRYLLQNCAIELFFANTIEIFFAFTSLKELHKFFRLLRSQSTPLLIHNYKSLNPRHAFKYSPWTELWRRRQISNFDYLMRLNILSGRSYNDITQYPVFPWIIADYSSDTLDFNNAKTFRALDKPIGALNDARLKDFLERYRSFDDSDSIPRFMYGSHYSSAGVVMHYMIRQEPFTSLAIALQGGRFDCPDRLFFDLQRSWQGVNHSMSDVKELIPELFCCPEILINTNRLPLGELQEGGDVDHVHLPPWARGNPYEFIRLHREALESDYVSDNLHHWIDLIFGYKVLGPAAVAANNVFYYLTYEDAVDIESIADDLQREAAKAQVTHFGQTPSQLLIKEHPKRLPKEECMLSLCSDRSKLSQIRVYTPTVSKQHGRSNGSIAAIRNIGERIVVFHSNYEVCYYKWAAYLPDSSTATANTAATVPTTSGNTAVPPLSNLSIAAGPTGTGLTTNLPFTLKMERNKILPSASLSAAENLLKGSHMLLHGSLSSTASTASDSASTTSSAAPAPALGGGLFSSWRSSFRGTSTTNTASAAAAVTNAPAPSAEATGASKVVVPRRDSHSAQPNGTTLYNAMRIEQKTRQSVHEQRQHSQDRKKSGASFLSPRSSIQGFMNTSLLTSLKTMSSKHVSIFLSEPNNAPNAAGSFPLGNAGNANINNARIITCGYWDNTLKVHALDTSMKEVVYGGTGHLYGAVTCLCQSTNHTGIPSHNTHNSIVITGGFDGTMRVWIIEKPSLVNIFNQDYFNFNLDTHATSMNATANGTEDNTNSNSNNSSSGLLECVHVLWGHSSPIQSMSYNSDLDLVVSGGSNGLLCIHSVRQGQYVRSMAEMSGAAVDVTLAASPGYVVAHSWTTLKLVLFWMNGEYLLSKTVDDRIECMVVAGANNNVLICGTSTGKLSFREIWSLEEIHTIDLSDHGGIKCLWLSEDQQFLFIGCNDGTFSIATDPESRWKVISNPSGKNSLI